MNFLVWSLSMNFLHLRLALTYTDWVSLLSMVSAAIALRPGQIRLRISSGFATSYPILLSSRTLEYWHSAMMPRNGSFLLTLQRVESSHSQGLVWRLSYSHSYASLTGHSPSSIRGFPDVWSRDAPRMGAWASLYHRCILHRSTRPTRKSCSELDLCLLCFAIC